MLRLDSITPLGNPVVPDVYCMLITSSRPTRGGARVELRVRDAARRARAARAYGTKPGRRVASPMKISRFSAGMRPDGAPICDQLVDVVDVAEPADGDERRRLALAQQVVDVARAQRGVGGDENRADLRERELQDHPFGHVGRPQHDALAAARRRAPSARARSCAPPARARRTCTAAPRRRAPRGPGSARRGASRSPTVTSRYGGGARAPIVY